MTDPKKDASQTEHDSTTSSSYPWLFTAGFSMVLVGVIILAVPSILQGNGSTGVGIVIFIGPVPIVFGSGQDAILTALLAVFLAALTVAMFYLWSRKPS